ncbi:hypothetical protein BDV93DRAFT_526302 [Ceratobasidium sp. AG-I]|nr:hypothetical protein BDV93DRAFT_526302 [Ceratobasidium sp. AG-I]
MSSALDTTFGATYIGVVIATFLYGILTLQTYTYWIRYIHDSTFDRLFVVALWIADTLQLIFICHMQYHYSITNYANPAALQYNNWSFNMEVGLTAIITFMVQAFFARRAFFFTKRIGSRITTTRRTQIMGAVIGLTTFTGLGFGLASFVMTFILGKFEKFIEYRWLVGGWLGAAAACDIMIVYMLSTALMTQRTGFGRTDMLIDKLMRYTINTGLLTSIIATVDLIAFCTMNNLVHLAFNFVLGKLYTNTLLATLNARDVDTGNVIHVESDSYKLSRAPSSQILSGMKFTKSGGGINSQHERTEPVIHLQTQTETVVDISTSDARRAEQGGMYHTHGGGYNNSNKSEFDIDEESLETKKGRW